MAGQDHILFNNYSRAADDEMPDQRAEPPKSHAVAPDLDRLDERQEEEESDDAAQPPNVARTRAFQEQDQQMNSRTHQAKHLISGMLKGLSGPRRDQTKGDDQTQTQIRDFAGEPRAPEAPDGESDSSHSQTRWHDDSEESVLNANHRETDTNGVRSPTDARPSEDGFSYTYQSLAG